MAIRESEILDKVGKYNLTTLDIISYQQQKDESEGAQEGSTKLAAQIRMKSPLVRFRLGDLYGGGGLDKNMMLGFIKSINYTVPDNATWENSKDSVRPKLITCTMTYQVVHETVPNYLTQFYGKQQQVLTGPGGTDKTVTGGFHNKVEKSVT